MDRQKKLIPIDEEPAQARPKALPAPFSAMPAVKTRYKLLISDLDNTLLDEEKKACETDLKAIKRLVEAGFIFTFATGRGPGATARLHKQLGANAPAIIFNGARIVDFENGGKVIFSKVMERGAAIRALEYASELNTTVMAFEGENCMASKHDKWVDFYERSTTASCLVVGDLVKYVSSLPSGMELTKMIFFSEPGDRDGIIRKLQDGFPEFTSVATTPCYSEMLPLGVSKGFALTKLAKYLGLETDEIVAVGDAPNDIEMMEVAGLGAAVMNADDVVKASADIIVGPVGQGGIAELISIAFGI
ncbi:MAG TPA: HAD family hydrolase [Bacillota bacterium]|nr:MAG: putative phosphatase [Firmicutes bacterium ADurb.Bin153]HNV35054.1 HAD family hydrolase [Bacillota bacterium]HPU95616.1 HAD family hydrolase [Bacillota bacterium]